MIWFSLNNELIKATNADGLLIKVHHGFYFGSTLTQCSFELCECWLGLMAYFACMLCNSWCQRNTLWFKAVVMYDMTWLKVWNNIECIPGRDMLSQWTVNRILKQLWKKRSISVWRETRLALINNKTLIALAFKMASFVNLLWFRFMTHLARAAGHFCFTLLLTFQNGFGHVVIFRFIGVWDCLTCSLEL